MFFRKKYKPDIAKSEKNFKETLKETPLEKNDMLALIIAGFIIMIPVILIVGGLVLLVFWLMGGF